MAEERGKSLSHLAYYPDLCYNILEYKFEYIQKQFENSVKKLEKGENPEFMVDLL